MECSQWEIAVSVILGVLLVISEVLGTSSKFESSGIIDLFIRIVKDLLSKTNQGVLPT